MSNLPLTANGRLDLEIRVPATFWWYHEARWTPGTAEQVAYTPHRGHRVMLGFPSPALIGNLYGDALHYAYGMGKGDDEYVESVVRSARRTVTALRAQLTKEQLDACERAFWRYERETRPGHSVIPEAYMLEPR